MGENLGPERVRLRDAWAAAWSALGADVGPLSKVSGGQRLPSDRAVKSLFGVAFDNQLEVALRRRPQLYGAAETDAAERILRAVVGQGHRFRRTARFLPLVEGVTPRGGWKKGDRRENLIRIAWDLADDEEFDAAQAREMVAERMQVPTASGISAALEDRAFVTQLEALLATRTPWTPPDIDGADLARRRDALVAIARDFLDDEEMADYRKGDPPTGYRTAEELWGRLTASSDLDLWHLRAQSLRLSDEEVVPVPRLRAAEEVLFDDDEEDGDRLDVSWLDEPIESRARGALRGPRELRVGLPDERELLRQEIDRAVAPLGLGSSTSRALVVVGAVLASMVQLRPAGDRPGYVAVGADCRAVDRVARMFARWLSSRAPAAAAAGLPGGVEDPILDPVPYYVGLLWRRVHGHEVRGATAGQAPLAWSLLTGVARTLTDRLDAAASRRRARPVQEAAGAADVRVTNTLAALAAGGVDRDELCVFTFTTRDTRAARRKWRAWVEPLPLDRPASFTELIRFRDRHRPDSERDR